jgi:acyl-CoA thioester hydrolase
MAKTAAPAPLEVGRIIEVRPEWVDYNGHMNVAYFVLAFDLAIDEVWERIGFTAGYREARRGTTFAVESHTTYARELTEGAPMRFTMQLLGYDEKRIHHFYRMYHAEAGYLAATCEWMTLHVDLDTRRVAPMPADIRDALAALWRTHVHLPWPEEAGRSMRRPRTPSA